MNKHVRFKSWVPWFDARVRSDSVVIRFLPDPVSFDELKLRAGQFAVVTDEDAESDPAAYVFPYRGLNWLDRKPIDFSELKRRAEAQQ